MALLIGVFFFAYGLFVLALCVSWYRKSSPPHTSCSVGQMVSVVVAARNEESSIIHLLHDLDRQSFQDYEVIVVDDHSDDSTPYIIEQFAEGRPKFAWIKNLRHGKKEAITAGVLAARGSIVMVTDADCRVGPNWIAACVSSFDEDAHLILGPVRIATNRSFFSKIQAIEFASLIGSAASSIWAGQPLMANAANMAFLKKTFLEVDGFSGNLHIPSGDDEFLLRKIHRIYPMGIRFHARPEHLVTTQPVSFQDFLRQRLRWAGKWKNNSSRFTQAVALAIWTFHALVLVSWVCLFQGQQWVALLLLAKMCGEYFFLRQVCRATCTHWSLPAFIFLQLVHSPYVVFTGALSLAVRPGWKGRR